MSSIFIFVLSFILLNMFGSCPSTTCEQGDLCSLNTEQKVGQLFIIGIDGTKVDEEMEAIIKNLHPSGVLLLGKNIENKEQLEKLISDLQVIAKKDTGLSLFIAVDQEGGVVNRIDFLEEKTAQKDIKTKEKAYQVGFNRGKELKELGVNLNLAPLLDEVKENDFIFNRAFQENQDKISELAKELIRGQKEAGILTCIKHFPGYGGVTFHPEDNLGERQEFPETKQFGEVMEQNPEFVMTANVVYKEIGDLPFTFLKKGVEKIKKELGDSVLIMSDDLDQYSLLNNYSLENIVVKPVEAGVDILIFSGWRLPARDGIKALLSAVEQGKIEQEIIDKSLNRIIEIKEKLK